MKYTLILKSVGKGEKLVEIWDDNGKKRPVRFSTKKAAQEAAHIVEKFNENSAFQYCRVCQIK